MVMTMRNPVTRFLVWCAASLFLGMGASAQAPAPTPAASANSAAALPTGDQVYKHYVEAIGGRAAWQKLHTRVSKGTIEIPAMNNLSGTIEVHMKAPNLILVVINLGGAIIQQGFDGTTEGPDAPRNGPWGADRGRAGRRTQGSEFLSRARPAENLFKVHRHRHRKNRRSRYLCGGSDSDRWWRPGQAVLRHRERP